MRYFDPRCELGSRLPAQVSAEDKLGGLPFGIDPGEWPRCGDCGEPLSLIGQFVHDDVRLDLGGAGRTLTVWQCERDPGMCDTWAWESTASQAIVSDLVGGRVAEPLTPETPVHPEARVVAWDERDDGVPADAYGAYFDDDRWMQLTEEQMSAGGMGTRIGGVPVWIQGAGEAPSPPWTFAVQIADGTQMASAPPTAAETGLGVQRKTADGWVHDHPPGVPKDQIPSWIVVDDSGWYLGGPNLGGGGSAYVFLDRSTDPPAAGIFWQS
jgi:hypothetical protein